MLLSFSARSLTQHLVTLITLIASGFVSSAVADEPVDFNRDIRPILSSHCLFCHGIDEESREAGLRLDRFEDATSSDAIVPGQPEKSELIRRLLSEDPDEVMPPPETEKLVTADEKKLLQRWISEGAVYDEHWAWRTLKRPPVPANPSPAKPSETISPIDAFLQSQWRAKGIRPVAPAAPRQRLRRLSFDLRGLPPSPDEVREFESNPSEKRFLEFRDRWMGELGYAEHQAVRWLDLVRWADTSGFVSDEPIASGAYRAWVINTIAENMPFDQFSIEQLAGDLLPDPTDDQLIASGYNRIVNTNCEAGAIEEEQLYKLKGEHVRAMGTVWLGMTTGCAECHDHKFDPFTAKDYYSLAAFYDDLIEAGVYTPGDRRQPLHHVHEFEKTRLRDRHLAQQISTLREQIDATDVKGLESWTEEMNRALNDTQSRQEFVWIPAQVPAAHVIGGEFRSSRLADRWARESTASHDQFRRHHAAELMTGFFSPGGQKSGDPDDAWFVDLWIDPNDRPTMIGFQISNGKYGRLGWQTASYETYFWGEAETEQLANELPFGKADRIKRVGDLPTDSGWIRLLVPLDQTIKPVGGKTFEAVGMGWIHQGGHVGWGNSGLQLRRDKATQLALAETGMRRWWDQPLNRQAYQRRMKLVDAAVRKPLGKRDDLERTVVAHAFREHTQTERITKLRRLESELALLRADALPVLVSRSAPRRKVTRLLHRGDYQDRSGPELRPAFPEFLSSGAPQGELDPPLSRLDLARWLFSPQNPITPRVFVNRLWHQFYGRGLSETLEDSGTQGDTPSHPALLDWLACEFRQSGWDRNHMIRMLTSTKAYQLGSRPSPEMDALDPGNRMHARQGRYRMTAEMIRDTTLVAAGLFTANDRIPTHSFFPYQPSEYWTRSDKVMYGSRHMLWDTSLAGAQYQRSVYTFWKRQNVHPTLLAFDAPTRQECTAKRNVTNTPGQALALLNDPMFVESARVMAMRVLKSADANDSDRIQFAFQIALQRDASHQERQVLLELLAQARNQYQKSQSEATQLVSVGQHPQPPMDQTIEVAAWTMVTRAILNLHEFLNRS